jgi:hypothetical protein
VDFTDQAQRQRQRLQSLEAEVHCLDVVDDVEHVGATVVCAGADFPLEQILQGALRPLDLRAEDRLPTYVHADEEVGVGDHPGHAVETAELGARLFEQGQQFGVRLDRRRRRQRLRDEGRVFISLGHEEARAGLFALPRRHSSWYSNRRFALLWITLYLFKPRSQALLLTSSSPNLNYRRFVPLVCILYRLSGFTFRAPGQTLLTYSGGQTIPAPLSTRQRLEFARESGTPSSVATSA